MVLTFSLKVKFTRKKKVSAAGLCTLDVSSLNNCILLVMLCLEILQRHRIVLQDTFRTEKYLVKSSKFFGAYWWFFMMQRDLYTKQSYISFLKRQLSGSDDQWMATVAGLQIINRDACGFNTSGCHRLQWIFNQIMKLKFDL